MIKPPKGLRRQGPRFALNPDLAV